MTNHDRLGKDMERAIVRWAKTHGFPHADRIVRTGAGKGYGHRPDEGDLWLCPGVIVQSKRLSPVNRAERAVPVWMGQTAAQREASGADIALLVVRREGCADVGQWWAWLNADVLHALTCRTVHCRDTGPHPFPVRLQVADAARLVRAYGYGASLNEVPA